MALPYERTLRASPITWTGMPLPCSARDKRIVRNAIGRDTSAAQAIVSSTPSLRTVTVTCADADQFDALFARQPGLGHPHQHVFGARADVIGRNHRRQRIEQADIAPLLRKVERQFDAVGRPEDHHRTVGQIAAAAQHIVERAREAGGERSLEPFGLRQRVRRTGRYDHEIGLLGQHHGGGDRQRR